MIRINQYDILPNVNARTAIYRDCRLSRYAELAYLSHFIGCFRPSLQIACLQHYPMYILEDGQKRFGISFLGPELPKRTVSASVETEISGLHERWLVLAPDHPSDHKGHLVSFIATGNPTSNFDAIFLFDYFKSTIQIIK